MDLIILVLVLSVIGFAVWLITTKIPMDPMIRLAIKVVAVIVVLLYALRVLRVLPNVL